MARKGTALAALALAGTAIACSDPKPPASRAAVFAELGVGACAALPTAQSTITYGDPNPNGARITNGEGDFEVSCVAFEEGDGFRLVGDIEGGTKAIFIDGTLSPVGSGDDVGCLASDEAPEGHLAGPVTVSVTLNGRGYDNDSGECWASVGPGSYGKGKARGTLCCSVISGDTASEVCGIVGAKFVFENCDVTGG